MTIKTALISVSDKEGVVEFAQALAERNIRILSTGGTARLLQDAGLQVTEVSEYTQSPEILDGRVKTLHPRIHAGLLARRDKPEHLETLRRADIGQIDLLVVNLYPFVQTIADSRCTFEEAVENIDIGGPAMLRAAAKNHGTHQGGVTVVIDPADYGRVLDEIDDQGSTSLALRLELAAKVFAHTAEYDGAISNYLSSLAQAEPNPEQAPDRTAWPRTLSLQLQLKQNLRYGENPHQQAAFYRDAITPSGTLSNYQQLHGKELSYNNIADADAAWEAVRSFSQPACVIVKHANPCGAAIGHDSLNAYQKAFKTDPTSAFGGIIAFNRKVDLAAAQAVSQQFTEVLLAPEFDSDALQHLQQKKNVRILQIAAGDQHNAFDVKRVGGGWLLQQPDCCQLSRTDLNIVSKRQPTEQQLEDMLFAWHVAQWVKSNAIVFCADGMTMGVGAGQMSRLDSARIAAIKAQANGLSLQNTAAASDAFFPFRDGLDVVVEAGASCVIHPGGSIRDDEVIAAADEHDIVMAFTGIRHFRH